jgi:ABC-type transport system involved in cytochrome bd biosynthesis fused ATPase/permease subunit
MSVALRTTANRMAAAVTPPTMGIMASMLGLAASFLLMGTVVMTGLIMVAMHVARKEREQREAELEDW